MKDGQRFWIIFSNCEQYSSVSWIWKLRWIVQHSLLRGLGRVSWKITNSSELKVFLLQCDDVIVNIPSENISTGTRNEDVVFSPANNDGSQLIPVEVQFKEQCLKSDKIDSQRFVTFNLYIQGVSKWSERKYIYCCWISWIYTELPKHYLRPQTTVACDLGYPAGRQTGPHTDAAPKHSLLFQFSFRVDGHAHRRTFAKRKC